MKYRLPHIVLTSVILILISCAEEVSQEDLVKAAVDIKLEQWKLVQLNSCKEIAYTKAEDYVDSLLLVNSLDTKLDTIPKPLKPVKPAKPGFKIKPDSVVVDPIYKKE
ncbi:MAG TPA: hypothetical protein VLA46_08005 [Saprospiraceae bacterium]|nr:hypothetical protein [Saprospiraceae bacterium]